MYRFININKLLPKVGLPKLYIPLNRIQTLVKDEK
jgi:hypothetical protein